MRLLPIVGVALAALLVLPALATVGDASSTCGSSAQATGSCGVTGQRCPGTCRLRFIRNVGHVLMAGVPALLLMGATVAISLAIDGITSTSTVEDWVLRHRRRRRDGAPGVVVVKDRIQFRAALVLDRLVDYAVDDGGLTPDRPGIVGRGRRCSSSAPSASAPSPGPSSAVI